MSDISTKELERLYDQIDADIEKHGLPTEEELKAKTEQMNETALRASRDRSKKHEQSIIEK